MKPVAFEYCRADTLEEVYELLDEFGSDASIISGGLSLGAMLNMRLVRPAAVGDINGAYPKTYGGAWRFPGDRAQCIAPGRPMAHLKEEPFQRRVPVRHQAARTARGQRACGR